MERVHDGDRVGECLCGSGFEAGEAVHRDDLDPGPELCGLLIEPVGEHGLGPAGDQVEEP